jgi:hypothetical protein
MPTELFEERLKQGGALDNTWGAWLMSVPYESSARIERFVDRRQTHFEGTPLPDGSNLNTNIDGKQNGSAELQEAYQIYKIGSLHCTWVQYLWCRVDGIGRTTSIKRTANFSRGHRLKLLPSFGGVREEDIKITTIQGILCILLTRITSSLGRGLNGSTNGEKLSSRLYEKYGPLQTGVGGRAWRKRSAIGPSPR